eukprot:COSAG05_NODE_60_length_23142_cov_25.372130_1_plen_383_part_10
MMKTRTPARALAVMGLLTCAAAQNHISLNVTWSKFACTVTDSGGKLHKTGCANGWNAGAISSTGMIGDAAVEFTCTVRQRSMLGFGTGNSHHSYTDIDCALYCDHGTLRVVELGRQRWSGPKYTAAHALKVERVGTKIAFYQNNKKLRTCGRNLGVGAIFVDTSIRNKNAGGINSARWIISQKARRVVPLKWTALKCAKDTGGGGLKKIGCQTDGWSGSGISKFGRKTNTEMQFRCPTRNRLMIGFAKGNSHDSYQDIDCALFCAEGATYIYELGRNRYRGKRYTTKTTFALKRNGTYIRYYQDGKLLRTCGRRLSGEIVVDTSIYRQGRPGIEGAVWVDDYKYPPPPPPCTPTEIPNSNKATNSSIKGAFETSVLVICNRGY